MLTDLGTAKELFIGNTKLLGDISVVLGDVFQVHEGSTERGYSIRGCSIASFSESSLTCVGHRNLSAFLLMLASEVLQLTLDDRCVRQKLHNFRAVKREGCPHPFPRVRLRLVSPLLVGSF